MEDYSDRITVTLQIALNKRMYEAGRIDYDTYSRANEILISRLTSCKDNAIINHSERNMNYGG